jgi:ABC-2 type transport system permease protein
LYFVYKDILKTNIHKKKLIILDKMLGFLNKFLAPPAPRESMLYGKIIFIGVRGLLQATVILLIATALGVRILNPVNVILIYLTLFLFSVFFSALSTMVGLYLIDHDSYAAVNSMVSMPLFFAGSALMPYEVMPCLVEGNGNTQSS